MIKRAPSREWISEHSSPRALPRAREVEDTRVIGRLDRPGIRRLSLAGEAPVAQGDHLVERDPAAVAARTRRTNEASTPWSRAWIRSSSGTPLTPTSAISAT